MILDAARAAQLVESFKGKQVLVVGDVMLDEFIRGDVSRISPEAPVPVVELRDRFTTPGGAGNAAANVVSLGGRAAVVGLVGDDPVGTTLRASLDERGIDAGELVAAKERVTTHKLRVVAHTQQIVRVDSETRDPLGPQVERALADAIARVAATADAVLLSDYAKGVVTPSLARVAIDVAARRGIPVVVDPKGRDYGKYRGATVITPNVLELETATATTTGNADAAIVEAGHALLASLAGTSLVITRGARGMTWLHAEAAPVHLPTLARSVFDVTGAGDTVVGSLVLALASGATLHEALVLASHAARIAVSKPGTAAVTRVELLGSFESEGD
jgi:rfaE bifunctional protein kinase chain/domain